jgi:hypothetical protein
MVAFFFNHPNGQFDLNDHKKLLIFFEVKTNNVYSMNKILDANDVKLAMN